MRKMWKRTKEMMTKMTVSIRVKMKEVVTLAKNENVRHFFETAACS